MKGALPKGMAIEVQRNVGSTWERATYVAPMRDLRGHHEVRLPDDAEPRWLDSMSGNEVERGHERAVAIRRLTLPSRRIRAAERGGR